MHEASQRRDEIFQSLHSLGLATLKQGYTDWRHFPGFFLDGKYYLGPELMTAIGWLEGQQFYYDELDPTGEPVFPNQHLFALKNPQRESGSRRRWHPCLAGSPLR